MTCYANDDCDHDNVSVSISASVTSADMPEQMLQTDEQYHTSNWIPFDMMTRMICQAFSIVYSIWFRDRMFDPVLDRIFDYLTKNSSMALI